MSNKTEIDAVATHPIQSWVWGEFRKAWGNEVVRFNFGQITLHKVPLINYKIGVFEKGPIPTKDMLEELISYGNKNNLIFIKLEPNLIKTTNNITQFEKLISILKAEGCVKGRRLFTPESFWVDLTKSEEDLLKSFSSKTRYNIRVAQRHGVVIEEDNSPKAFEKYLELSFATSKRQRFFAHTTEYHRLMWKHLHQLPIENSEPPIAKLLTAKYKGEIITAWILFVWHDFLYYPYGASSDKYKNVMASNLMMWEAIRFGKSLGLKTFDLWGREPGKGFTRFKEGYNPKVVEFIGTWDLVINKSIYFIYRIAENVRWFLLKKILTFLR